MFFFSSELVRREFIKSIFPEAELLLDLIFAFCLSLSTSYCVSSNGMGEKIEVGHLQWEVSESVGCKLALPISGEDQMTRIYCAVLDIFWNICATLITARF